MTSYGEDQWKYFKKTASSSTKKDNLEEQQYLS